MEKKYCIYIHINKANKKVYIGQTCQNPERRWRNGEGYKDSPLFYLAIQKYGWNNFEHKILETNLSQAEANERERYWIKIYNANNKQNGYNLTPGGQSYMAELWAQPEYKEKMKKSFSKSRKKQFQNIKIREQRLSTLKNGIKKAWNDPQWREKRIEKITGDKNPNSKKVINLETNKVFSTIKEAATWAQLKSVSGIGQCCRGKQKTSGKHPITGEPLHWRFYKGVR